MVSDIHCHLYEVEKVFSVVCDIYCHLNKVYMYIIGLKDLLPYNRSGASLECGVWHLLPPKQSVHVYIGWDIYCHINKVEEAYNVVCDNHCDLHIVDQRLLRIEIDYKWRVKMNLCMGFSNFLYTVMYHNDINN